MRNLTTVTVGGLMMIILMGCDPIGKAWQDAEQANTIESYRAFRADNPASEYDVLALERIDGLAWDAAVAVDTETAYAAYLEEHADGANAVAATDRIRAMRLERFTEGIDGQLLAFIRGEKSDIVSMQGKSWDDLSINIGLQSGGFDLINGRTVIREGSQIVLADQAEKFQFVGTVIEAQYASSVKPASLVSAEFTDGVTLGLASGDTLKFVDQRWVHSGTGQEGE